MTTTEEIGARLVLVRKELKLSQKAAAQLLGIGTTSLSNIETGANVPSGETLLKFEPVGYNPGWILTGLGPKRLDERPEPSQQDLIVFIEILPEIGKAVERAYKASNARINEMDLVHGAAKWLGEIQKVVKNNIGDRELLLSLMPWVEAQVKREIAEANAGERKRSGSG